MKNYTVNKMDILAVLFWIMIMGFYTPYQAIYYVYQATVAIIIFIAAFSEKWCYIVISMWNSYFLYFK